MSCSICHAGLAAFFSGGPPSSPVSTTPSGVSHAASYTQYWEHPRVLPSHDGLLPRHGLQSKSFGKLISFQDEPISLLWITASVSSIRGDPRAQPRFLSPMHLSLRLLPLLPVIIVTDRSMVSVIQFLLSFRGTLSMEGRGYAIPPGNRRAESACKRPVGTRPPAVPRTVEQGPDRKSVV